MINQWVFWLTVFFKRLRVCKPNCLHYLLTNPKALKNSDPSNKTLSSIERAQRFCRGVPIAHLFLSNLKWNRSVIILNEIRHRAININELTKYRKPLRQLKSASRVWHWHLRHWNLEYSPVQFSIKYVVINLFS